MGGLCCTLCSLSSLVSIILHAFERISLCTMCALLTCCIMFTIIAVLISGIGIGFHYCVVQHSVQEMEKAAKVAAAVRSGPERGPILRSSGNTNTNPVRSGLAHRIARRETNDLPLGNKNLTDVVLNKLVYSSPNTTKYTS